MINNIKRLVIPLFLFLFMLSLILFGDDLIPQLAAESVVTPFNILYYLIQIVFWLSAAALCNRLFRIFIWEGIIYRSMDGNVPKFLVEIVSLLIYVIAITVVVGYVFEQPLTGLWATSGVVALIIGFALRNIILDLFTGLAINIERPYKIGDWIKVHQRVPEQNITGMVTEINWRATRVKTEQNTTVIIPNSIMSVLPVTNYWKPGFETRQEIDFYIDYSVQSERVRRILMTAAQEVIQQTGFVNNPPPEVIIRETNQYGVHYQIRYWIKAWRGIVPSISKDRIITAVLKHLSTAGIALAYPKHDIYFEKMPARQFDTASLHDRKKIVSRIELFSHLEQEEIDQLAINLNYLHFKSGSVIVESGDDGDSMYIIVEGLANVHISSQIKGERMRVAQLSPGEFFGEMSLLTGEPRSADVIAATDVSIFQISREHMSSIFQHRPEIIEKIAEILVERKSENVRLMQSPKVEEGAVSYPNSSQLVRKIRAFFKGVI